MTPDRDTGNHELWSEGLDPALSQRIGRFVQKIQGAGFPFICEDQAGQKVLMVTTTGKPQDMLNVIDAWLTSQGPHLKVCFTSNEATSETNLRNIREIPFK